MDLHVVQSTSSFESAFPMSLSKILETRMRISLIKAEGL